MPPPRFAFFGFPALELIDTFPPPAPVVPEPIVTGFDAESFEVRFGAMDVFARVVGRLLSTGSNGLGRVDVGAALDRTAGLPFGGWIGFAVVVDFRRVEDGRLLSAGSSGFGRVDFALALDRTAGLPSGG